MRLHLQPSNLLRPGLGQPGEDGAGRMGLDELLGGPEAICWCCGIYPDHLIDTQTQLRQPAHMRFLGRPHQVQATTLTREYREGRPEQAPLADRCLRRQELGQAAPGPASTGQLVIERSKAGWNRGCSQPPELSTTPEGICNMGWPGFGLQGERPPA